MTTILSDNRSTEEHAAALAATLETWVTALPAQEQELLASALSRAAADDVLGHGGIRGGIVERSGSLAAVVAAFLPPQVGPPGSALIPAPLGPQQGILPGGAAVAPTGGKGGMTGEFGR